MINTTTKKQFSLFDFCKKRADKIQVFGKETIDEDGKIIPFVDQAALITHYLQLRNADVKMPYERQAEDILNLWYEFVRAEMLHNWLPNISVSRFIRSTIPGTPKSKIQVYRLVCWYRWI